MWIVTMQKQIIHVVVLEGTLSTQWCQTKNVLWLPPSNRWRQWTHEQNYQPGHPFSCGKEPERLGMCLAQNLFLHHEHHQHLNELLWFSTSSWPFPANHPTNHTITPLPQALICWSCCQSYDHPTTEWHCWHEGQFAACQDHSSMSRQNFPCRQNHVQHWRQSDA